MLTCVRALPHPLLRARRYFGEYHIHAATSDDLVHWKAVESNKEDGNFRGRPDHADKLRLAKELISVVEPRPGYFDSELVEPGPPAIITKAGVLLIYNSKNRW